MPNLSIFQGLTGRQGSLAWLHLGCDTFGFTLA